MKTVYFELFLMHFIRIKMAMAKQTKGPKGENLFGGSLIDFIPKDHPVVKLRKLLPWEELTDIADEAYYALEGNPKISPRIMVGILIYHTYVLKRTYREISDDVSFNLLCQYLCGFNTLQYFGIDHSTIIKFEQALGDDKIEEIMRIVERMAMKKQPPRSKGQSVSDTTVIESNIEYPTDTKILENIRLFLHDNILKYEKVMGMKHRTYAKTARDLFVSCNKKRKISKKEIKKIIKKQLQFVKRNIKQLEGLIADIESQGVLSIEERILFEMMTKKLETAKTIYDQQYRLNRKEKLEKGEGRIVSFYRPEVRPIYRGKAGKKTEFGIKICFTKTGRALILDKLEYENYHDSKGLVASVEKFKKEGWKDAKRIGDKGFNGQHSLLKANGIENAIEPKGKRKRPKPVSKKVFTRERARIEGLIGTFKGLATGHFKSRMKTSYGDRRLIRKGVIGYNLRYALLM